ncbi:O-antigen ligase family protein [Paraburkholderia rhizosphaerae]|nr:O-antigen ligase family protein [Paraburkholderia rhizosphaerae]
MKGGTGYCFFIVLALSLLHLGNREYRIQAARLWREHRWFLASLFGLPCIVLFQILVMRTGTFPSLDPLLRLPLAIPSFFFLASMQSRQLRMVQWGFAAGALAAGAWSIYALSHPAVWTDGTRLGNSFTNPIPFGDTALLLGFLSIASLRRADTRGHPVEIAIKFAALVGGLFASYLSGTRGGWIAIPVLLWFTVSGRHWLAARSVRIVLIAAIVGGATGAVSTHDIRARFTAIATDLQKMREGNADTSTGARLELWRASALLYTRHPVLGVGRGSLAKSLGALSAHGEAPNYIVNDRAHNDFFSILAEMGTVGVAALLLLYSATFMMFWRLRRNADPEIATAAYLGLLIVSATILFGMTIDVFTLVMNVAFFALTIVTLLAWIEARKREIAQSDRITAATRPIDIGDASRQRSTSIPGK